MHIIDASHDIGGYDLLVLSFGAVAFGLFLLIKGGDWTVDAACAIAKKASLSKLFIGMTIIAFGTSVPELFTSVNANLSGYPGLSLGNVVGSNIANVLFIIGVSATIFAIHATPRDILRDMVVMVLATILLTVLMRHGEISRWMGIGMFATLVAYIVYQYRSDKGQTNGDGNEEDDNGLQTTGKAVGVLLAGLAALALGSEVLVRGAVSAGSAVGVPEAIIGLTVVAFGTSLPELVTCVAAARKRQSDLIVGNIIGSNIFNILSILAITAAIKPLVIEESLAGYSMWVMVACGLGFAAWMLIIRKLTRIPGIVMLIGYVAFVVSQYYYQEVPA